MPACSGEQSPMPTHSSGEARTHAPSSLAPFGHLGFAGREQGALCSPDAPELAGTSTGRALSQLVWFKLQPVWGLKWFVRTPGAVPGTTAYSLSAAGEGAALGRDLLMVNPLACRISFEEPI